MAEGEGRAECYSRITELWNETLGVQKSLQDVDLKIVKNNERIEELDSIYRYISNDHSRIFEKVGRLFIETSPEAFKEKLDALIDNTYLERSRELLLIKFKRLESLLRGESDEEPLFCLRRALSRRGEEEAEHNSWVIFNVQTGGNY